MMSDKLVLVATFSGPTVRGSEYKETAIVDRGMSFSDAMDWANSIKGSAVLIRVELTIPREILIITQTKGKS